MGDPLGVREDEAAEEVRCYPGGLFSSRSAHMSICEYVGRGGLASCGMRWRGHV
jgi:hypothetical protein